MSYSLERSWIIDKSETILVTGAGGFVGSKVVELLLEYGFEKVQCLVRSDRNISKIKQMAEKSKSDVEIIKGNLLSRDVCTTAAQNAAVIYHLAAGTGKSYPDCVLNSVVTTRNLLDAVISKNAIKRFVNISSIAVYSNEKICRGGLMDETSSIDDKILDRHEPYTYGKVKQDEILLKYAREHNLPYVILRPSVVFGPGKAKITDRIGTDIFGIFLHLGLNNTIPLTYIDNCADAIVRAGLVKGIDGQIFNIVDDNLPSSKEFLNLYKRSVRDIFSIPVPYHAWLLFNCAWEKYSYWSDGQLPPVFNRGSCAVYWKGNTYSNKKAKELLAWKPKVDMRTALIEFFDYMQRVRG